ncbi:hypothetical protein [Dendronalium sp. ChiSLP03b]|uniref:hypothetical protein n=1 Tax=Dendronalium sp. ChiSLP03b TaxID=3075381 RepID=UPI002ADA30E6|nr:hypothetical protein [Dendronalium sp. ChiSLP03b]
MGFAQVEETVRSRGSHGSPLKSSNCLAEGTALGGFADLKQVSVGVPPPVVASGVRNPPTWLPPRCRNCRQVA